MPCDGARLLRGAYSKEEGQQEGQVGRVGVLEGVKCPSADPLRPGSPPPPPPPPPPLLPTPPPLLLPPLPPLAGVPSTRSLPRS